MSTKFYEVINRLDQLRIRKDINKHEIIETLEYLKEEKFTRYFFLDLDNPEWVLPLYENKFFLSVPPPFESPNNPGYFSMPEWYAGEYLKRMAEKFPNIVKDTALFLETKNSRAIRTIIEALIRVPVSITAEIVHKFKGWIETPYSNFMMLEIALGRVMEYLAIGGEVNAALSTLSVLLDPIPHIDKSEEGKLVAGTPHDYYWLNQALELNLPSLIKNDPIGVISVAEKKLIKAINMEHDPKVNNDENTYYSYWRMSINPRSDTNYDNEIKNLLVDTIITSMNMAFELEVNNTKNLLNRYIQSEYSIFRRIGNYLLRSWGQKYPDLLEKTYELNKELSIKGGTYEFNRLIEIQFNNLPQSAQKDIIHERLSPNLQRVEELLNKNPDKFDGETIEEKKQTIVERWQLQELTPLASFLEGETKKYYEFLKHKYGEPAPRLESGTLVSSWSGPESPIMIEELSKKSIKEVTDYLLSFIPSSSDSFGAPSREGLARILESDVQARADNYATNINLFVNNDLPFVYHTYLLRGLENAVKNKVKFSLVDIASLCEFITKQDNDNFIKQDFEEGLPAAKLAIVKFLEQLFRAEDAYIEGDLLDRFGQVITSLLHQDEQFPYDQDEQGFDPIIQSLNCVHGVAMHSLVSYGLYYERKRRKEMGEKGKSFIAPMLLSTLNERLDKKKYQNLVVHSIFGWYFPQLIYLDKGWVIENREKIFPDEEELLKYWQSAWSAYIQFSDVYSSVFPKLINQYRKAIKDLLILEKKQEFDRSSEKMATHILKAYLLDMIEFDSSDGLLMLYYKHSNDEIRSNGNLWLNQVLDVQKPSSQDRIWNRIWTLWQWRIREIIKTENKEKYAKEISSFCRLLKNVPLSLPSMEEYINFSLGFKLGRFEVEEIIKFLGKNAKKYPKLSIKLFFTIIISRQDLFLVKEMKIATEKILVFALKGDQNSAKIAIDIINIFGERGDYSWRPLLDHHSR